VKQVREHRWSLDACVGYARLHDLFETDETVCTKTLYNTLRAGQMPLTPFELPEMLKRKPRTLKNRANKRPKGRSIEERPAIANERSEIGHWEADTVVGRRTGMDSVVLTLLEKSTNHYIALRIPGRTSKAVLEAISSLRSDFGDKFRQVFKTITSDNGAEFEDLSNLELWGTKVYFAHPYSSWERPQNERHNGLLRRYIPKGVSIDRYHAEEILAFSDEINGLPRKLLGYHTPEELFETFLDKVYAA
jgi:IS30 family transposase